jgi:hypothetical protein
LHWNAQMSSFPCGCVGFTEIGYGEPAVGTPYHVSHASVQEVGLSSASALTGRFRLVVTQGITNRLTAPIEVNAPDQVVQAALQAVPGIAAVTVVRSDSSNAVDPSAAAGYLVKWYVYLYPPYVWSCIFLLVFVCNLLMLDVVAHRRITFRTTDGPVTLTTDIVTSRSEVQEIDVVSGLGAAPTAGSYRLSLAGTLSACIPVAPAATAKVTLENALLAFGAVTVTYAGISSPGAGTRYTLTFNDVTVDAPQVVVTDVGVNGCAAFATGSDWAVLTRTKVPAGSAGAIGVASATLATSSIYAGDVSLSLPWISPGKQSPSAPTSIVLSVVSSTVMVHPIEARVIIHTF